MSVIQRPVDNLTELNLLRGIPFVDFGLLLASGGFAAYENLGIISTAQVAKEVELATLRSAQSGTSRKVRELVSQFDASLEVALFSHVSKNLQLMFASSLLTSVSASTPAVTDDPFSLTDDNQDFGDLANPLVSEAITGVTCGTILNENIGTAIAGKLGDTLGDFSLDFKPLLVADCGDIEVTKPDGTVDTYTAIGLTLSTTGFEYEVELFTDDATTAGRIEFHSGGAAAPLTAGSTILLLTYKPSHAFVEANQAALGDFIVDYKAGRVRLNSAQFNPATEPNALELKSFQPMEADYTHTVFDHDEMSPYTKFVFPGRARIRLLTDVGRNIIWPVPSVSVRLTGDPFVFSDEGFTATPLLMDLLDNGGANPYGVLEAYPETP